MPEHSNCNIADDHDEIRISIHDDEVAATATIALCREPQPADTRNTSDKKTHSSGLDSLGGGRLL